MGLTEELRAYANARGVDLVGCTSPEPLTVREGAEPFDPRSVLPDARAVVIAATYTYGFETAEPSQPGRPRGRFGPWTRASLAAWHYGERVVKGFLQRRGHQALLSNDMPYKALAVRSGIASYGRNCIVHADGYGSYLKLAGVITDAKLACADRPVRTSDCSGCTACVEACPTGALDTPYRLRIDRCITAWLWGRPMDPADREKIGPYIFRCGYCQDACPKNQGLQARGGFPFRIEARTDRPELIPLLLGDESQLREILPAFPLEAGVETIRRNVAIALGNSGEAAAVPALAKALREEAPCVRGAAAWALGRLGGDEAKHALEAALSDETDGDVRGEIAAGLQAIAGPTGGSRTTP